MSVAIFSFEFFYLRINSKYKRSGSIGTLYIST